MKYSMKRFLIYSAPVIFLLAFSSCKKFLEEKIYSQQFQEKFYTNADEADGALRGIINTYSGNTNYRMLVMEEYLTDNLVVDASRLLKQDDNLQFTKKNVKVTNSLVESNYADLYSSIYNANAFIYNMEHSTWTSGDSQRPQYIAEAYTLRAMAYFKLVRLFGAVPLIINIKDNTPDAPIRIGRTPVMEIYTQIISDLKTAKTLYLQEGARSGGYPSKIMARLLLSEVYLTMNGEPLKLGTTYLDSSKAEADTLIHAKATGVVVPSLVNFDDVFTVENENRGEIIFSAQNYGTGSGQIWAIQPYSYGALSFDLLREFDVSGPIDLTNPNRDIRGVDPNTAAYDLSLYTSASNFIDGRFYPTIWPYKGNWNSETKVMANFYNALNYLTTPSLYTSQTPNKTVYPGKYRSDFEFKAGTNAKYPHYDKKANVIMYRWAEAYLLYAEADNERNGPQPDAIAAVNTIRKRAGLQNLSTDETASKEAFRNAIRREWRLEFVSEGKHFYNLQRWGTLIDEVNAFVKEYNSYNPSDPMELLVKGKNELYPLPFSEIERTGFTQNPGY